MFGKKDDIVAGNAEAGPDTSGGARPEAALNGRVELDVKANSFSSAVFPKPGHLVLGDRGIEFLADSGVGFIQIPWASVDYVTVDVVAKRYVRSITVATDETSPLEFVVSDGKNLVRCLDAHLGRERLRTAPSAVASVGRSLRARIARLFHRGDAS